MIDEPRGVLLTSQSSPRCTSCGRLKDAHTGSPVKNLISCILNRHMRSKRRNLIICTHLMFLGTHQTQVEWNGNCSFIKNSEAQHEPSKITCSNTLMWLLVSRVNLLIETSRHDDERSPALSRILIQRSSLSRISEYPLPPKQ